jgi:hypothetical protein
MDRRQFLTGALTLAVLPAAAVAQTAEAQVIEQLKRQGYGRIEVYRTLLGRTRIVAVGARGRREIILNPSSGAILRDYEDRSFRDDDDADEDDDNDDDRSGSNSGKGSGNDKNDDGRSDNSGKGNSNDDDDDDDDDEDDDDDDGGDDDGDDDE